MALTVKSRRTRSSAIVSPNATTGFRVPGSYASARCVVTSTCQALSPSRSIVPMVPKSRPMSHVTWLSVRSSFSMSSGRASVVKSRSSVRVPNSASRTGPPTTYRLNPPAANVLPSRATTGSLVSAASARCWVKERSDTSGESTESAESSAHPAPAGPSAQSSRP